MLLPDLTRKKSRVRQMIFWIAVVLAVAMVFSAKPLYRIVKKHRAESLAQQGELLLSGRKADPALTKLQAALELDPNNFRANCGMARLLTAARRSEAFSYWDAVFSEGGGTNAADRTDAATLAIVLKRPDLVGNYLDPVLRLKPVPPEALRVAAIFCDGRNNAPETIRFARAYLQSNPNDADMSVLLARRLLNANNSDSAGEAKSLLWKVLRAGGSRVPAAIQLLANAPNLTTNEIHELLGALGTLPQTDAAQLMETDLRIRLTPGSENELLSQAIADATNSPEKFLDLCRWLNQKGEFGTVEKIVSLNQALQSKDLFLVYADALAAAAKWTELESIFNRNQLPVEPVLAELYRARIAMELKKDARAQMHWEQALSLGGQNAAALEYIGGYAERVGALDRASEAYRQLARDPANARAAYEGLIRVGEKQGDTAGLRDLMQTLVQLYPTDPAPQNDLAYLNLLLNNNVDASRRTAENLVQENPQMLAYHTTLALACLRAGDAPAAKKAYEGITFSWADALPGWQAVYVATIGANKQTDLARKLAPTIRQDRLKPEEKRLVQPWLD